MSDEFLDEARRKRPGLLAETWAFLRENKRWWLVPIVLVVLLLGGLLLLGGTGVAPFVYTLF